VSFVNRKSDLADRRHSGFMLKVAFVTCTGARAVITLTKSASAAVTVRIEFETLCFADSPWILGACVKTFPDSRGPSS
jgi:hypothetical protein